MKKFIRIYDNLTIFLFRLFLIRNGDLKDRYRRLSVILIFVTLLPFHALITFVAIFDLDSHGSLLDVIRMIFCPIILVMNVSVIFFHFCHEIFTNSKCKRKKEKKSEVQSVKAFGTFDSEEEKAEESVKKKLKKIFAKIGKKYDFYNISTLLVLIAFNVFGFVNVLGCRSYHGIITVAIIPITNVLMSIPFNFLLNLLNYGMFVSYVIYVSCSMGEYSENNLSVVEFISYNIVIFLLCNFIMISLYIKEINDNNNMDKISLITRAVANLDLENDKVRRILSRREEICNRYYVNFKKIILTLIEFKKYIPENLYYKEIVNRNIEAIHKGKRNSTDSSISRTMSGRSSKSSFYRYDSSLVIVSPSNNYDKSVEDRFDERVGTILVCSLDDFQEIIYGYLPSKKKKFLEFYISVVSKIIELKGGMIERFSCGTIICNFNTVKVRIDHEVEAIDSAIRIVRSFKNRKFGVKKSEGEKYESVFCTIISNHLKVFLSSGVLFFGNYGSDLIAGYDCMGKAKDFALSLAYNFPRKNRRLKVRVVFDNTLMSKIKQYKRFFAYTFDCVRYKNDLVFLFTLDVNFVRGGQKSTDEWYSKLKSEVLNKEGVGTKGSVCLNKGNYADITDYEKAWNYFKERQFDKAEKSLGKWKKQEKARSTIDDIIVQRLEDNIRKMKSKELSMKLVLKNYK